MADLIPWLATAATIIAACMTASNLGSRVTGYGFAAFTVGSVAWLTTGLLTGQPALAWTNAVLTGLNLIGVWRWLGRQARVEEGARSAVAASEAAPGEALFPVSLLTRASVECGGEQVGDCIDAMAGCGSGQLAYVVVAEGGVAGLGETLRRVPWKGVEVERETLVLDIDRQAFCQLEQLPKDQWPAR